MKVKKGQLLELSISGIAFGGKGLARVDGLAVFVDKAAPLDVVIARIIKKRSSMQRPVSIPWWSHHHSG